MNPLENAFYAFSIAAISLQIVLLVSVLLVLGGVLWKVRNTKRSLQKIAPIFLVMKVVNAIFSMKKKS